MTRAGAAWTGALAVLAVSTAPWPGRDDASAPTPGTGVSAAASPAHVASIPFASVDTMLPPRDAVSADASAAFAPLPVREPVRGDGAWDAAAPPPGPSDAEWAAAFLNQPSE